MPKKLTDAQRAFLDALEEICEQEMAYYRGSMSDVEHDLALKQRMRCLALNFRDILKKEFKDRILP